MPCQLPSIADLVVTQRPTHTDAPGLDSSPILSLPSPTAEDVLSSSVSAQSASSNQIMLPHESAARALEFNEEIGLGAISRAGALPVGSDGQWLEFAERKLKNDASLDYQALIWELGSEIAERQFGEQGGMNITYEQELLVNMEAWFAKGGGKLHLVHPVVDKEHGFRLLAVEDIDEYEPIISCPLQLIMCKQTARNVLVKSRGKYLGEELQKTFEKDELLGMVIFVLHEYYKEMAGSGSKWGPFLRTLRMRFLATNVLQELKGTIAVNKYNHWLKQSDNFMWWSTGADGPCSPTTGICKTKPNDRAGDSRFNVHQIRWAYWVVKQNAVRIKQISTGLEFIALIPFYNMLEKRLEAHGGITFDLDGSVSVRSGKHTEEGLSLSIHPGNISDSEFFLRYMSIPKVVNEHTEIKLKLPGVIPKGSKFHYCVKGTQKQQNRDDCKASYRSESMFWKSKVLSEWRSIMNLPPRLQELRMWATRLHLYGGQEEMALLSGANQMIAGLPIPVDQMPAEEQLMLLGIAKDNIQAALIASGPNGAGPPPQLYNAPDPEEDHEADRAMQNLATLAVQAQRTVSSGNTGMNVTQAVLNHTRNFFVHGVLPMAGLDELDNFLLKKIGMLSHCGFEEDMKITIGNVTEELMCAMRVHLMNESEMHVFCPKEARVWEDNCLNVEFMNYTAISENNELDMVNALRASLTSLLGSYPTTMAEDAAILRDNTLGTITMHAIGLRYREKEILMNAMAFLDEHERAVGNGTVPFQLALKALEREAANQRDIEHKAFVENVRQLASMKGDVASIEVNMGDSQPKVNLTLLEGNDIKQTIAAFCRQYQIQASYQPQLEKALRARIVNPKPLNLMLGAVTSIGDRHILAVPDGANATIETGVFCVRYDDSKEDATSSNWCQQLMKRVDERLNPSPAFQRRILLVLPIDAPDGRKLQLVLHEGEQHDLVQYVSDFFEVYRMPRDSVMMVAEEVHKRLPAIVLQLPVGLPGQRQVAIRFSNNDNVTNVVAAFANFFDIEDGLKVAILKKARQGMAPGTFLV